MNEDHHVLHYRRSPPHSSRRLLARNERRAGNTFARTPNVKYIISHAGGTIPYLAARFSIVDEMKVIPGAEERGAGQQRKPRRHGRQRAEVVPTAGGARVDLILIKE
jgi:hypothetical protein